MENHLVTVVVPTYNRASLILDALDSVYAQTYRPIELIVVDDGSTDDTKPSVYKWIDNHKTENDFSAIYMFQKNSGGNVARNLGISAAQGECVGFLDSDDLWHKDKLSRQMKIFKQNLAVGGVYCGLRHMFIESGEICDPVKRGYPSGNLLSKLLIRDVTAPTSAYVVRRDVFKKVGGFDETLQARQDWDMWIRLASEYEIGVVPEALVDYREHSGVRTATNPQNEIDAYKTIMAKYSELRSGCSFSVRQASVAAFYRRMGRVYFHHKISKLKAVGFYLYAIIIWPFAFDSYAALLGVMIPVKVRQRLNTSWNSIFGVTRFAIRSH